jgi:hypothetical protein
MKTSPFLPAASILIGTCASLFSATENHLTIIPSTPAPIFDQRNVNGVAGDAAPGFEESSFASNGVGKTDIYFTPELLFGRAVAVGEIAEMSYWTKTGATHDVSPVDWSLLIYTKPYSGDISSATWYGDRFGAEPYFAINPDEQANTWNRWSTNGATNRLRFYESTAGAPGATFGTYTDPDFAGFVASPALSGANRATRDILFLSLQTGSGTATGFTGKIDGFTVKLKDGSVATVNLEADSDNDGVADAVDACVNSDLRPLVDVNGAAPGNTGIPNTVDENGCSIQDLVLSVEDDAKNHGAYVSGIGKLSSDLVRAGRITAAQGKALQTGAAKSDIGK